ILFEPTVHRADEDHGTDGLTLVVDHLAADGERRTLERHTDGLAGTQGIPYVVGKGPNEAGPLHDQAHAFPHEWKGHGILRTRVDAHPSMLVRALLATPDPDIVASFVRREITDSHRGSSSRRVDPRTGDRSTEGVCDLDLDRGIP